jgi:hypothetical protein
MLSLILIILTSSNFGTDKHNILSDLAYITSMSPARSLGTMNDLPNSEAIIGKSQDNFLSWTAEFVQDS